MEYGRLGTGAGDEVAVDIIADIERGQGDLYSPM